MSVPVKYILSAIWWFGFPSVIHDMSFVNEGLKTHYGLPDKAEGYKQQVTQR